MAPAMSMLHDVSMRYSGRQAASSVIVITSCPWSPTLLVFDLPPFLTRRAHTNIMPEGTIAPCPGIIGTLAAAVPNPEEEDEDEEDAEDSPLPGTDIVNW